MAFGQLLQHHLIKYKTGFGLKASKFLLSSKIGKMTFGQLLQHHLIKY
jgi:hypothetical protein